MPLAFRTGLPAATSVIAQKELIPTRPGRLAALAPGSAGLSGSARTYRILRTNEVDPKDAPVAIAAAPFAAAPVSDNFTGTARKAAKLSMSDAKVELFTDLPDLVHSLPSRATMVNHTPAISTDAGQDRVAEEERNVQLRAFLYAASREADNDFHLIIGRDPNADTPMYMTAEVSGLPEHSAASFATLKAARDAYQTFFGADGLPGTSYDFYDPPIPVEVTGSLFFDMSHASGNGPGPQSLRHDIPTIWEIHPITHIVFEP
jgi:hypothetical protein